MATAAEHLQHELASRNRWFISLRWLAASGIVACTLIAGQVLHYPLPTLSLLTLGLAVAAYNSVLRQLEKRLAAVRTVTVAAGIMANVQISLDLVALAALIHLAGGIENPFALYFVFHMILAAILLSPLAAYGQATLAAGLYSTVLLAEQYGFLPHVHVFEGSGLPTNILDVLVRIGVFGSTLYIAVFLTASVARRLQARTLELARAMEEATQYAHAREQALQQMKQAEQMQLEYMRRVSHELRSPLATVATMLKVIRDGFTGDVDPKQRELIGRSEARLETALDMVDDLLTISRMRDAPQQEPKSEVAVAYLVDGVIEHSMPNAEHKGVSLTGEVRPGLPAIYGQPDALRTMMANLVGNAVKYTPAGGRVVVRARPSDTPDRVVLAVSDTGTGIAQEDLPRLFDPFFRTESARQSQVHGTGLGLSIVDLTVKANSGHITVTSEVGKGTTFEVSLPTAFCQIHGRPMVV